MSDPVTVDKTGDVTVTTDPTEDADLFPVDDQDPDDNIDDLTALAFDDVVDATQQITTDLQKIETLNTCYHAIDAMGISPASLAIGQATGIFKDTTLASIGCESIDTESRFTKELGTESLFSRMSPLVEKAGRHILTYSQIWSGRLLKSLTSTLQSCQGAYNGAIARLAKRVVGKSGSVFSRHSVSDFVEAGKTARLNGKTALVLIASLAAVSALVAGTSHFLFSKGGVSEQSILSKLNEYVSKIRWPFGKLSFKKTDPDQIIGRLFCGDRPAKSAMVDALKFRSVKDTADKTLLSKILDGLSKGVSKVGSSISAIGEMIQSNLSQALSFTGEKTVAAKDGLARFGMKITSQGIGKTTLIIAGLGAVAAVVGYVVIGTIRLVRHYFNEA